MKKILLLLLGRYKLFCAILTSIIVFISIIYAFIFNSIKLSEFLVLILAWVYFLTIIWNISYVFAPSVNEDSNIYDVVSRWGLVFTSFFMLTYVVVNFCFI